MPQVFQRWYKHDINDWRGSAAVQDMSDAEYRAYHNLLMAQFESEDGMLPSDEVELAKLSRKRSEWPSIRQGVLDQFERGGEGRIYNARMYHEWKVARELSEKRSAGGQKTAAKRYGPPPESNDGGSTPQAAQQSCSSATAQQVDSYSSPTTQQPVNTLRNDTVRNEEQEQPARPALERPNREPTEAELDAVRMAYPRKTAPPKSRDAIRRAVVHLRSGKDLPALATAEALEYLHGRAVLYAASPAGQQGDFTPHCATWFNQGRYLEHESEWQRSGDGGRANGADRQQPGVNGGGVGSPAEQRVADSRSRIANAFGGHRRAGGDGAFSGADGGELLASNAGRWTGRVVDAAVVGHSASA